MQAAPERRWTLKALAAEAGCSRAVFAQRFSALVGQGSLSSLTAWRMHVAAGLLLDGTGNIGTVASWVGYRSEAAFSIAFKRWAGNPTLRISPQDASCRSVRIRRLTGSESARMPHTIIELLPVDRHGGSNSPQSPPANKAESNSKRGSS